MNNTSSPTPRDDHKPLSYLEEQLLREERRFADAMLRRARLFAEIAARKRDSKRKSSGQELEKALWKVWENTLHPEDAPHSRQWRQLVAQCNNLGYAVAEQKAARKHHPWVLRPIAPAKTVSLTGPTDIFSTKILTFWAVAANSPIQLSSVVLNDGVIDLIKSLNQLGAGLSWENESISHTPHGTSGLSFEQKTVHAGQTPFTLALVVALALARPGIAKFSGSGALNMLQLKPWQNILPQLGARLHQLNPHAPGLPVRLESNGQPIRVAIDESSPPDLTWALLAAAPFYPNGLELSWNESLHFSPELETLTQLFSRFAVPYTLLSNGIHVSPAVPQLPEQPTIPLDYSLCSMLLGWSRMTGQKLLLHGSWPDQGPLADKHLDLLRACGVLVEIGPGHIHATPQPWPDAPTLDVRGLDQALPLAVSLALSAPRGCAIIGESALCDLEPVRELTLWTERACRQEEQTAHFTRLAGQNIKAEGIVEAPDSLWAMALAMLSFRHPGLQLTNPGELTILWPSFWTIYHNVLSLSKKRPEIATMKASEKNDDEQSQTGRRRIKI